MHPDRDTPAAIVVLLMGHANDTPLLGYIGVIYKDNGKEHANYYSIFGFQICGDNGKESGNYYSISGLYIGVI